MICEHERIHLETSTTLMRELPLDDVQGRRTGPLTTLPLLRKLLVYLWRWYPSMVVVCSWANLGRTLPTPGTTSTGLESLKRDPSKRRGRKSRTGNFSSSLKSGGYASPDHWSEDGWAWQSFRNTKWPHFWERTGPQGVHEYALRLPFRRGASDSTAPSNRPRQRRDATHEASRPRELSSP